MSLADKGAFRFGMGTSLLFPETATWRPIPFAPFVLPEEFPLRHSLRHSVHGSQTILGTP